MVISRTCQYRMRWEKLAITNGFRLNKTNDDVFMLEPLKLKMKRLLQGRGIWASPIILYEE